MNVKRKEFSMNGLLSFFKKIRIGSILAVFIAGVALFSTTAYNSGNLETARPTNPPVQVGGNNNPHSRGDGYTNHQMSTDLSVNHQFGAAIGSFVGLIDSEQFIAANDAVNVTGRNPNGIIYSAPDTQERPGIGQVDPKVFERDAKSIPAQRQPVIDRSDPDLNILEKVGDAFKEGSSFLKGDVDQAAKAALENAERKGER